MNRNARYGHGNRGSWLRDQLSRKPKPVWVLIVTDVVLIGISLVVFALFHHVLPRREQSTGIVSSRYAAQDVEAVQAAQTVTDQADETFRTDDAPEADVPAVADAPEITAESEPEAPVGDFSARFPDKFTDGQVIKTENSYQSANLNIALNRYEYEKAVFYVADIYIRDIECFRTAFAEDRFGRGVTEKPTEINKRVGGVLAVNGDYYGTREDGVVIRNGELYRDKDISLDVCVLYWDGTLETYNKYQFDAGREMKNGAYQAWHFGPKLLDDDGKPMTHFSNATIGPKNPRTVLGYFEPGHYCFVVVDGRSEASEGLTIKVLAQLVSKLGCKRAYNMDGGATSMMVIGDRIVNNPYNGGRPSSDIIYIADKS